MLCPLLQEAAKQGAQVAFLPEVSNCVSLDPAHQAAVLRSEGEDPVLHSLCLEAQKLGLWIVVGLAFRSDPPESRFANRCVVISTDGEVRARYDKIHMFDVTLSETETYRESRGFAPGGRAVLAHLPFGDLGLSICYDLRFAQLYRRLAQAGAQVICVPSAFSPVTGPGHWQVLLQARAIETGCWIVAPAQCGTHHADEGRARMTYGHSLIVSPWGEVIHDAGEGPGCHVVDLDLKAVSEARRRLPSLSHDRYFEGPA